MTISEVTQNQRIDNDMTLEQFSTALCADLPGYKKSRQEVSAWEKGKQNPAYNFLMLVWLTYEDWRSKWALRCLEILKPQIWAEIQQDGKHG